MSNLPQNLARKAQAVEPFYVMDILARAVALEAAGADVIHLEIGEPDFSAPEAVLQAASQSLQQGQTHYSAALGIVPLREAIADFYQTRYQLPISPEQIGVSAGASAALGLVLAAILNPGDKVLLPDPSYPCNRHFVRIFGGVDVNIPVDASSNFQLNPANIAPHLDANCKAVMVASPSNPCGTVIDRENMRALAEFCQQNALWLIVDEIYSGIHYGDTNYSAAEFDNVIVINSFSKYFAMTGLRAGWFVIPKQFKELMQLIDKLAQNFYLCPPITAQYAALSALLPAQRCTFEQRVAEFKKRRDYLLPELEKLGFSISAKPVGAFYIYANCARFLNQNIHDSSALCQMILERAHVAITPGKDFGSHQSATHVRFAYTRPVEVLQQAVTRLQQCLTSI